MTIRLAQHNDFKSIQRIAKIVWPATFETLMPLETMHYLMARMYSTQSLTQQIEHENIRYLIIEESNETLGYCSYELNYQNKKIIMVHRLYFLPEQQGRGLGTKVLNYICDLANKKSQKGICLKVLHSNIKAYKYYLKYGFIKKGEAYNHIGGNYPPLLDYVLEKSCTPTDV